MCYLVLQATIPDLRDLCMKSSHRVLRWLLNNLATLVDAGYNGEYSSIAAALVGDRALALKLLRRWPQQAAHILREYSGSYRLLSRDTCSARCVIADPIECTVSTPFRLATHALGAAAAAIHATGHVDVGNVHLCGDGYAGKSTIAESLARAYGSTTRLFLGTPIPATMPAERTLGMVCRAVESSPWFGNASRISIHDYHGQAIYNVNHAAHLTAPNSVYLLVVPLWDMRPSPTHDGPVNKPMALSEIADKVMYWLKFLNTVVPSTERKAPCITVLNFARQLQGASGQSAVDTAVSLLESVQRRFCSELGSKLEFVAPPIAVNGNIPASVHKRIVPF